MSLSLDFALFMRNSKTKLGLSLSARGVAFSLAFRIGSNAKTWVSQENLAIECGVEDRNLRDHLNSLGKTGIIIISKQRPDKRKNSYNFNPEIINYHQMTDEKKRSVHKKFGDEYYPAKVHQSKNTGRNHPVLNGDTGRNHPVYTGRNHPVSPEVHPKKHPVFIDLLYGLKIPKDKDESNNKSKVTCSSEDERDRFDDVWDIYPRKQKKQNSKKVWKKNKLNKIAELILQDIAKRKKLDCQWQNKQYIPLFSTYLNGEGWMDEIIEQKQINKPTQESLKANESPRNPIKFWEEGNPDYDRVNGVSH